MVLGILTSIYLFLLSFLPVSTWSHGFIGHPQSFLPTDDLTDAEKTISNLVYRSLVKVNPQTGEIENDLMESYKVEENGRVYTIKLKENQYWHDGELIDADDLLYTASVSSNLREVSSDKIDDYTVRFTLPNKYSPFISILNLAVLPEHLEESNSKLKPVGSGDFRLVRVKRDRARIREVVFTTNKSKYPFRRLNFRFYNSEGSLRTAMHLGEIDSMLFNKKENITNVRKAKKIFRGRSYVLTFNTTKDYLDKEARKNIMRSIDYDQIIDAQEYEGAVRPEGPLSGTWVNTEGYEQITTQDIDFEMDRDFQLLAPDIRQARLIAEEIETQLEEREVAEVDVDFLDPEVFTGSIEQNYDMVLVAHEYGLDPDRYVFWHSSASDSLNFSKISSLRIDKALEEGRNVIGRDERKEHYEIFQTTFAEEAPAVYLVHPTQYFYYSSQLKDAPEKSYYYPWELFSNFESWEKADSKVLF